MLEAGIGQYREWGDCPEARYLAAHSPKERAQLQTALVARRLGLGHALYEDPEDALSP